jgi:uncharacterized protein (DUF1684 family)
MRKSVVLPLIVLVMVSCGQKVKELSPYELEIVAFQDTLNAHYANPRESPLMKEDLPGFRGLDFYPIDKKYRVKARFTKVADTTPFKMKTSTDRAPLYAKYGKLNFTLEGKDIELFVYQSVKYRAIEKYKDELSLPYKDLTSGKTSYGGGRYIDLKIPEGDSIVIDFNKTYNPYCAYNHKYSCVIPPPENFIDLEIKAGTMKYGKH